MRAALAAWMRKIADRMDHPGAPKITHWTFTFEPYEGIRFREDGRGCHLAYLGDTEYEKAHDHAGPLEGPATLVACQLCSAHLQYRQRKPFTDLPYGWAGGAHGLLCAFGFGNGGLHRPVWYPDPAPVRAEVIPVRPG